MIRIWKNRCNTAAGQLAFIEYLVRCVFAVVVSLPWWLFCSGCAPFWPRFLFFSASSSTADAVHQVIETYPLQKREKSKVSSKKNRSELLKGHFVNVVSSLWVSSLSKSDACTLALKTLEHKVLLGHSKKKAAVLLQLWRSSSFRKRRRKPLSKNWPPRHKFGKLFAAYLSSAATVIFGIGVERSASAAWLWSRLQLLICWSKYLESANNGEKYVIIIYNCFDRQMSTLSKFTRKTKFVQIFSKHEILRVKGENRVAEDSRAPSSRWFWRPLGDRHPDQFFWSTLLQLGPSFAVDAALHYKMMGSIFLIFSMYVVLPLWPWCHSSSGPRRRLRCSLDFTLNVDCKMRSWLKKAVVQIIGKNYGRCLTKLWWPPRLVAKRIDDFTAFMRQRTICTQSSLPCQARLPHTLL